MENPAIEKVPLCPFDVAALGEGLGIAVNPLFSAAKVSSRLARTYRLRHGLKEVVQELVVWSSTSRPSSDWGRVEELGEASWPMPPTTCASCSLPVGASRRILGREETPELARRCFACIPVFSELVAAVSVSVFRALRQESPSQS